MSHSNQSTPLVERMWLAYKTGVGGTAHDGKPLPAWNELGERQQQGWLAAMHCALNEEKDG